MSAYRWICHEGRALYRVGVLDDGSLRNPNGYPEELVRAALAVADEGQRRRRSEAAGRAAETRRRRTERRVYDATARLVDGHSLGPASHCVICGRALDDPASVERGIRSECSQKVLDALERREEAQR
jgi:predicted nucleic acid-binding Zn ribbon protein